MRKYLLMGLLVVLAVSVIGCGGGGGVSGGDDTQYTPYTGSPIDLGAVTPTAYGQLQVIGSQLRDENDNPIQLKGMSTMGLQWFGYNADTVINLVNDWHISVFRVAMYVNEGGYLQNPGVKDKVDILVQEAIRRGIYVIIDWHTLNDNGGIDTRNPNNVKSQAKTFFDEMATKYGAYPNVIYEICNEPNGSTTWAQIKQYAEEVIPIIRAKAPQSIVIVGTPTWSQGVDSASLDPLNSTTYPNVMYTLHFYAGTHTQWLRDRANTAMSRGIALFVTEWGTSEASGNGGPFLTEAGNWTNWMADNKISWCNWSLCNKDETSAALISSANVTGPWGASVLSASGTWVKSKIFP